MVIGLAAARMLDAVERWAFPDYWLMRETQATVNGRLDGLLIPRSFKASVLRRKPGYWTDKLAVVGVEVKASREDFQRGLREGQFDRYCDSSSGLFVVTGREVKTAEVPKRCGHVICFDHQRFNGLSAACRRLPEWRDIPLDDDTAWRIVFYAADQQREAEAKARTEQRELMKKIGDLFATALWRIGDTHDA